MNKTLHNELKKYALECIVANTGTMYYYFSSIKVRVSDHSSTDTDADLDIYFNGKTMYAVVPLIGTYKQVQWFNKASDVVCFVNRFNEMAKIMLKPIGHTYLKNKQVKVKYEDWKRCFSSWYNCNNNDFSLLLDEFYRTPLTSVSFAKLKSFYRCKISDAYAKAYNLLKEVQNSK